MTLTQVAGRQRPNVMAAITADPRTVGTTAPEPQCPPARSADNAGGANLMYPSRRRADERPAASRQSSTDDQRPDEASVMYIVCTVRAQSHVGRHRIIGGDPTARSQKKRKHHPCPALRPQSGLPRRRTRRWRRRRLRAATGTVASPRVRLPRGFGVTQFPNAAGAGSATYSNAPSGDNATPLGHLQRVDDFTQPPSTVP